MTRDKIENQIIEKKNRDIEKGLYLTSNFAFKNFESSRLDLCFIS